MVGNAAHRNPRIFIPGGQRDIQYPRCDDGILEKHFVKIAHPEKENTFFVFSFNIHILLHRRSQFHGLPRTAWDVAIFGYVNE